MGTVLISMVLSLPIRIIGVRCASVVLVGCGLVHFFDLDKEHFPCLKCGHGFYVHDHTYLDATVDYQCTVCECRFRRCWFSLELQSSKSYGF